MAARASRRCASECKFPRACCLSNRCRNPAGSLRRSRSRSHILTNIMARREVAWTGKLLDENYEEFVFHAFLSDTLKPDTVLYFPVVQECEKSAERWIEIPAEGKTSRDYRYPAPGVKLMPSAN
jgi:hypothetical protein